MNTDIIVEYDEVKRCLEFAVAFTLPSELKSNLDFGNKKLPRGLVDKIADCTVGKIGEVAFQKFCKQNGLIIGIDFELFTGRHEIDFGQDVNFVEVEGKKLVPIPRVDIKTTKSNGQWLLLETHKHWCSIVVMITADLPANVEEDLSVFEKDIKCKFVGFAYLADFYDAMGVAWFLYKAGTRLLSGHAVDYMYQNAKNKYGFVTNKAQMTEFFKNGKEMHIGPELKCPFQVGLPRKFLRTSKKEVECLFNTFKAVSVRENLLDSELIEALINWNKHLSQTRRCLQEAEKN